VSVSASESKSFSSIMAIKWHYIELYGALLELGLPVPESAFTWLLEPLEDGNIDQVDFMGLNSAGEIEISISMIIDWSKHELVVSGGNSVPMPLRGGEVHLQQVRAAAREFMKEFKKRSLSPEFMAFYRAGLSAQERQDLDRKYGFRESPRDYQWSKGREPFSFTSRYHDAVSFRIEVADGPGY
jgi:hypothetical protein